MVLVKFKGQHRQKMISKVPYFELEFYRDPIDVPPEVAEKLLLNPDFTVVDDKTYYTEQDLKEMKISELRKIGDSYGIKDVSKEDLVKKILEKQGGK